ncbi:MAG TPA: hypothetical protein DCQ64_22175 [Candidatus Rokubacteria bacterium]|nr:hypothetical protein [Candidatus Rokubacteria bacterium]
MLDPEAFANQVRALCYKQHGGSGFNFTMADVLDMELGELDGHIEWLAEQREREADAIRRAGQRRA